jgi:hypothetical protein
MNSDFNKRSDQEKEAQKKINGKNRMEITNRSLRLGCPLSHTLFNILWYVPIKLYI